MLVKSNFDQIKIIFSIVLSGILITTISCNSDMGLESSIDEMNKTIPPKSGREFVADNPEIAKELSRLKKVVANIRTLEDVMSNGWETDLTGYIPNMGYHYANLDYLNDGIFNIEQPEAILVACGSNGELQAIAVEYIVPVDNVNTTPPPDGFTGDADFWRPVGDQLWTLHVWINKPNPDGIFFPTNTEVAVSDECSD